jgi:hypothetical protein
MTPNIETLVQLGIESHMSSVHVHAPARVTSFDAAKRTCSVEPLVKRPVTSDEDEVTYEDSAIVDGVPVLYPGGAAFTLTWELAAGDVVLLAYLDFSPATWLAKGAPAEPGDVRQHSESYPVAIPFYRPSGGAGVVDPGTRSMGPPGGAARIRFEPTFVQVGTGADFVALAGLVTAQLDALKSAISEAAVTPNDGGATFKANIVAALGSWPGPVAATQLKTG